MTDIERNLPVNLPTPGPGWLQEYWGTLGSFKRKGRRLVIRSNTVLAIGLATLTLVIAVYDILEQVNGGSAATLSHAILEIARRKPILPHLVGILVGHLFWPQD